MVQLNSLNFEMGGQIPLTDHFHQSYWNLRFSKTKLINWLIERITFIVGGEFSVHPPIKKIPIFVFSLGIKTRMKKIEFICIWKYFGFIKINNPTLKTLAPLHQDNYCIAYLNRMQPLLILFVVFFRFSFSSVPLLL